MTPVVVCSTETDQIRLTPFPAFGGKLNHHSITASTMGADSTYKLLLFFKRNPELSPSQFKAYYEANHVPMVMELAQNAKGLLRYTRRYLQHDASDPSLGNPFTVFGTPAPTVDFDIVNEVAFETKADATEFARLMYGIEENRERVLQDEEKLFVRSQMRGMLVEELVSIRD